MSAHHTPNGFSCTIPAPIVHGQDNLCSITEVSGEWYYHIYAVDSEWFTWQEWLQFFNKKMVVQCVLLAQLTHLQEGMDGLPFSFEIKIVPDYGHGFI